jgi:hypothetical protein
MRQSPVFLLIFVSSTWLQHGIEKYKLFINWKLKLLVSFRKKSAREPVLFFYILLNFAKEQKENTKFFQ